MDQMDKLEKKVFQDHQAQEYEKVCYLLNKLIYYQLIYA